MQGNGQNGPYTSSSCEWAIFLVKNLIFYETKMAQQ